MSGAMWPRRILQATGAARIGVVSLALWTGLASPSAGQFPPAGGGSPDPDSLRVTGLYASPKFIPNRGQFEERVRYVVPGRGLSAWVERDALVLHKRDRDTGRGVVLRFVFEEASPSLRWTEAEAQPGYSSFFLGPDPVRWQRRVPGFRKLVAEEFRPGVALELELHSGRVWYALRADPGTVVDSLSVRVEGAESLAVAADGSVLVDTALGVLRHTSPMAWEIDEVGARHDVGVSARVASMNRIVLEVSGRNPSRLLVVDPGLDWATYLGGSGKDVLAAARWHPDGHVTVAGMTSSLDFPVTPGAYDVEHGGLGQFPDDVCVARFLPDGSDLIWATYLGGDRNQRVGGLGVLDSGEVIVGGGTAPDGYPVTRGAFSTPNLIDIFMFVTRITAGGDDLVYSAAWGPGTSLAKICVDTDETIVIAGSIQLLGYPTTPTAFMPTPPSPFPSSDIVISRLSADGSHLVASTYLGGSLSSTLRAVAVRPDGSVVVAGTTNAPDFPVTPGAWSTSIASYVTCLDPLLEQLVFSTGSGFGVTYALAADASGAVVRTGQTPEISAPPSTPGAFQPAHAGNGDAFVQRFAPDGKSVLASTFLGSGSADRGMALVTDSAGTVTVVGLSGSFSPAFPVTDGGFITLPGKSGIFVSRVSPDAKALWYSSVLTTQDPQSSTVPEPSLAMGGVDLDDEGGVVVVSETRTDAFPTTAGSFDPIGSTGGTFPNLLSADGIVIRMDMLPHGVHKYGASTPGCAGKHAIGVTAQPRVGSTAFGLTCTNAEPFAAGLAVISQAPAAGPLHVQGAQLFVDPTKLLAMLPVTADELGALVLPLRIPADAALAGQSVFAQLLWRDTCSPAPSLSASNALSLTVQP